ncbi:MAG: DUF4160 domain-containing protein [Actinomycetota bacterium]
MKSDEHGVPHVHARYAEHSASIAIENLDVLGGFLPRRALEMAREWAASHRPELSQNWERARASEPVEAIEPRQLIRTSPPKCPQRIRGMTT